MTSNGVINKVCILGLGYVGLPTAALLATHGFEVVGVDVNPEIVNKLSAGEMHIEEPGLHTITLAAISSGCLRPALQAEPADAFIIAVPTPLAQNESHLPQADMSYVRSAAESIVPFLRKGNLVILESTSPVGTTEQVLRPILAKSGLEIGEELLIAYCPERVLPGKILSEAIQNDRIIGGINRQSALLTRTLYQKFVEGNIYLTEARTAEMCKLAENTYRDVNIAFANSLARLCEAQQVKVWDVIALANHHPRVNILQPGLGVGGHCIAVDPWFLLQGQESSPLIHTARTLNDQQPAFVLSLVEKILAQARPVEKVTLLGITYKANVDDTRESPAIEFYRLLQQRHPQLAISVYDPHVKTSQYQTDSLEQAFAGSDLAIVLIGHQAFQQLAPREIGGQMRRRRIYDCSQILDLNSWKSAGFETFRMGSQ